jgi:hypothetical protein
MPARFCSRCGTAVAPDARFCAQCGAPLTGAVAPATATGWQMSGLGGLVLGFFLVAGLSIWTLILSPSPPRPGPQGPVARAGAPAPTGQMTGQMPEGHPPIAQMPAEVKNFIADLEKKAKEHPDDVAAWMRLGQVNARAAQLDPSYGAAAASAFEHVLEREPKNVDALRGVANVHYDRNEFKEAIPLYERYLALKPDDLSAQTDLGTMYLSAGDPKRAMSLYRDVLRQNPKFLQAHYNMAVAYHRQGDDPSALTELQTARSLADDDDVRRQIDEMIAGLNGEPPPPKAPSAPVEAPATAGSPFQTAVETTFRNHPIMGPRIARFEWTGPGIGRVLVRDFPMAAMPDNVRDMFTGKLADQLRSAQSSHPVEGEVRVEIADASSGALMATIKP